MRVWNLTDVETSALRHRGLLNVNISVAGETVGAGSFIDVPDKGAARAELAPLLAVGAVHIGPVAPDYYLNMKPRPLSPEAVAVAEEKGKKGSK